MNAGILVTMAMKIATECKTLYVSGGWGQIATPGNKNRAINQYQYNRNIAGKIRLASADTYFFDCVCLIKSILWGFNFTTDTAGGAVYASNGVPDIGEGTMINMCRDVATDFILIQPGEAVYMPGHIGIYIGHGLAVECTPAWNDGVQITAVGNIGKISGYPTRTWTKHGKLPWVDYADTVGTAQNPIKKFTDDELAQMVIAGHFGSGNARKSALGERYNAVQAIVDFMLRSSPITNETVYTVKRGDTLSAIAKKHGTTVNRIAKDNYIQNANLIHVGQRLIIRK